MSNDTLVRVRATFGEAAFQPATAEVGEVVTPLATMIGVVLRDSTGDLERRGTFYHATQSAVMRALWQLYPQLVINGEVYDANTQLTLFTVMEGTEVIGDAESFETAVFIVRQAVEASEAPLQSVWGISGNDKFVRYVMSDNGELKRL